MNNDEMNRLAAEELLKEAKRGEARAQVAGSLAWLPGTVPSTDKRFLANTLRHTMASNRIRDRRGPTDHHRGRRDGGVTVSSRPRPGGEQGRPPAAGPRRDAGGRTDWNGGGREEPEPADRVVTEGRTVRTERGNAKDEGAAMRRVNTDEDVRTKRVDGNSKRSSADKTRAVNRNTEIDEGRSVKKVKR